MNLLLTGCFNYSEEQMQALRSLGYSIYYMQYENEELPLAAEEVDATVCNGLFLSHNIKYFSRLKLIQLTSAGLDRVPVDIINERGIKLYNACGVYSIPMAEWVIFRVLEHYKQGWFFYREQKISQWTKHRGLREVSGINVAVVGAGNVGQEVGKRFQALGAKTTGFDVHTYKTMGFDNMLLTNTLQKHIGEFDVLVLTVPLLSSTRGMINGNIMKAMKQNAMLVNIARGGLIDEQALYQVLSERKDLFASLDVFETEPLICDSPLWKLDNVAISPHNSFVGEGNNTRLFNIIYDNLEMFLKNNK